MLEKDSDSLMVGIVGPKLHCTAPPRFRNIVFRRPDNLVTFLMLFSQVHCNHHCKVQPCLAMEWKIGFGHKLLVPKTVAGIKVFVFTDLVRHFT